jgi:hypothetical protein
MCGINHTRKYTLVDASCFLVSGRLLILAFCPALVALTQVDQQSAPM